MVELLVGLTIAAILTGVLTHCFRIGMKAWGRGEGRGRFFTQAQRALELMIGEIRECEQLTKVRADTLELIKKGIRIRYLLQPLSSGEAIFRMVEDEGDWEEEPKRPLAFFSSAPPDSAAQLVFEEPSPSLVRIKIRKGKLFLFSTGFKRSS